MWKHRRNVPAWVVSSVLHAGVLGAMATVHVASQPKDVLLAIETIFSDEDRKPEEFTRDLDQQKEAAESLNFVAGGPLAAVASGSSAPAVQQTKIDETQLVKDPQVAVNVGNVTVPGVEMLGNDLGPSEVVGETGAVVEGYGAALDRFTQELIRLMREQKVLVVWLFDESESMKDDQIELKSRISRIYEELKLVDDASKADVLLTSVVSFGENVHFQLPKKKPTNDMAQIVKAIEQIPIDKSGKENTCQAIVTALSEHRRFATQGRRKMVAIVVSDESGDDGERVDDALQIAKSTNTAVYFMGRESVFGYLYAHVRWIHPQTGGTLYLPIRRGPETPFAEQLQIDGFRRRMDASMSGFGPYEQVRLARDTGGIFFMLPHEEQNIHDFTERKYAALDMKEYIPDIQPRRDYATARDKSEFRRTIWEVISLLNPYDPRIKHAEVPGHWYSTVPSELAPQVASVITQSMTTLEAMAEAQRRLEAIKPLRAKEDSRRWRANYDLILGQVMSYRVRLFEYLIALGQFAKSFPARKLSNPKANRWGVSIGTADKMLAPDAQQASALKTTLADMEKAKAAAIQQFQFVIKEHPNTPWSVRANWELTRGYGMTFAEYVQPPPPKTPPPPVSPPPNL